MANVKGMSKVQQFLLKQKAYIRHSSSQKCGNFTATENACGGACLSHESQWQPVNSLKDKCTLFLPKNFCHIS